MSTSLSSQGLQLVSFYSQATTRQLGVTIRDNSTGRFLQSQDNWEDTGGRHLKLHLSLEIWYQVSFELWGHICKYLSLLPYLYCSNACAINLGSTVLLTGGYDHGSVSRVTQYCEAGFVKDLPQLQQGRRVHGCSYFDNDEGTKVTRQRVLIFENVWWYAGNQRYRS